MDGYPNIALTIGTIVKLQVFKFSMAIANKPALQDSTAGSEEL